MKTITFVVSITALSLNLGLHAEEQVKPNNNLPSVTMESNQDDSFIDEHDFELFPYSDDESGDYSDDDSISSGNIEEDENSLDNNDEDS
jgi:hypothetical protein